MWSAGSMVSGASSCMIVMRLSGGGTGPHATTPHSRIALVTATHHPPAEDEHSTRLGKGKLLRHIITIISSNEAFTDHQTKGTGLSHAINGLFHHPYGTGWCFSNPTQD